MKNDADTNPRRGAAQGSDARAVPGRSSLIDSLLKRAGKVAGGTLDLAVDVATMSAMFGDSWVRDLLLNGASPERLQAMAEAGHFLRDARETAGLTIAELSDRLELGDDAVLQDVESGEEAERGEIGAKEGRKGRKGAKEGRKGGESGEQD
ncbi:MAG: hypothetical protein NWQ45_04815, partial [Congregibacter sp.]|nr:hypothetical protein [Congregibacter sp.]